MGPPEPDEDAQAAAASRSRRAGPIVLVTAGALALFTLFVMVRNDWRMADPATMLSRTFSSSDLPSGVEGLDASSVRPLLVDRGESGRVLVVMGQVLNESVGTKRNVRVEALVRDSAGLVVARREAPCGHIFSPEQIQAWSDSEIAARYRALAEEERPLRPRATIECGVIFESPPPGYSEATHRVELVVIRADPVIERSR